MGVKVRERRPGEWWIYIDHGGKRTAKKIGRDQSAAETAARKIEAKLTLGDFNMDQKEAAPTFKKYSERWLGTYVKQVRRISTYERYKDLLERYAYPAIGSTPIDKITRGAVRDLLLKLNSQGLSRSTVALMKDAVSGPFEYAIDAELIQTNPTRGLLKTLHLERDKKEHLDPLNFDETNLFLETCRNHSPEHYPFFLCAFRTGARLGELLALKWDDVDWNGKFVQVQRSFKLGRMGPTKTGKVRRVDLSSQLFENLRTLHTVRKREGLQMGLGAPVELVFHRNGEPMAQNSIRYIFKGILRKAKLRNIRFHDVRHSYASQLLSQGITPVYVKEQMGHSSIQMTVDIYGTWIPNGNRAAVNILDGSPVKSGQEKEAEETTKTDPRPPQLSATQTQPPKTERPQPLGIAAIS